MHESHEKTIISAEVPQHLKDELALRAAASDRSLSAEIRRALVEHLERDHSNEEAAS